MLSGDRRWTACVLSPGDATPRMIFSVGVVGAGIGLTE